MTGSVGRQDFVMLHSGTCGSFPRGARSTAGSVIAKFQI